jgi:hypothetical protein
LRLTGLRLLVYYPAPTAAAERASHRNLTNEPMTSGVAKRPK